MVSFWCLLIGFISGCITGYLSNKEIHIEVKYDGKEEDRITKSKKEDD